MKKGFIFVFVKYLIRHSRRHLFVCLYGRVGIHVKYVNIEKGTEMLVDIPVGPRSQKENEIEN